MRSILLALPLVAAFDAGGAKLESHPWHKFGEGSWIESEIRNERGDEVVVMTARDELVEKAGLRYRLETSSRMEGVDESTVERDFHYAFMGFSHLLPGAKELGLDTIEVLGRSYPCTVFGYAWRDDQGTYDVRVWTTRTVAAPVRIGMKHTTNDKQAMMLHLDLVDQRELVSIGRRRVACSVYAGSVDSNGTKRSVKQWRSDDIPGGIVRTESRGPDDSRHVNHVVDFGAFPSKGPR